MMVKVKLIKLNSILSISKGENYARLIKNNNGQYIIDLLRESYIKKGYIDISDDINSNSLKLSSESLKKKSFERNLSKIGDIVVRTKKPCFAAIIDETNAGRLIDSECLILRDIDEKINKYYLLSYLNSKKCLENIERLQINKDIEKITLGEYANLDIPILESNFETEQIAFMYKELIDKKILINRISNLDDTINNKRFEEILGDSNEEL